MNGVKAKTLEQKYTEFHFDEPLTLPYRSQIKVYRKVSQMTWFLKYELKTVPRMPLLTLFQKPMAYFTLAGCSDSIL